MLVVTALPAVAGATVTSGGVAAPGSSGHQVTIALDPGPSATWRVQVTPHEQFVVEGCQPPEGWTCGVEGGTATYQTVLGELGPFGLVLTAPSEPGNYPLTVRQQHATDPTATWAPTLTVAAPEPEPEPEPTAGTTDDDGGGAEGSTGEAGDTTEPDSAPSPAHTQAPSSTGEDERAGAGADQPTASAPTRRTQARSTGSSFEITPRRTAPSEAPLDPPAVDQPVVASPSLATGAGTPTEPDGGDPAARAAGDGGPGPGGGSTLPSLPWQQWAGALLLLTGALLLARQRGLRLAGAGATLVARVRGIGSATLRRVPGPWGG